MTVPGCGTEWNRESKLVDSLSVLFLLYRVVTSCCMKWHSQMGSPAPLLLSSLYPSFVIQEKLDCTVERRRLLLLFSLKYVLKYVVTGEK